MGETGTVLVVEDDQDLRELIRIAGRKRSYRMLAAGNGLEAKGMVEAGEIPGLVILDITMPGMDGFGFCRWLREDHPLVPVIFLSARAEEYDKIVALEIGGDDYLTKPFSMRELFARVEVGLRRVRLFAERGSRASSGGGDGGALGERGGDSSRGPGYAGSDGFPGIDSKPLVLGAITIDPGRWTCTLRGEHVILTVSEFRILHRLLENPGIVISREKLAEAAFPEDNYNLGRSVDVHIHRIRKKLQAVDAGFDPIETVYQVGYRWKE